MCSTNRFNILKSVKLLQMCPHLQRQLFGQPPISLLQNTYYWSLRLTNPVIAAVLCMSKKVPSFFMLYSAIIYFVIFLSKLFGMSPGLLLTNGQN